MVALAGEPDERLLRAAASRSLLLASWTTAELAYRELLPLRPQVVIVQVPTVADEALQLISLIANGAQRIPIIAAAVTHTDDLERAVRRAGATYYVPGGEWHRLEEFLFALAEPPEPSWNDDEEEC